MRTWALRLILVSIGINAAIAIYAVVRPGFGDVEAQILGTSLAVTAGGILALGSLVTRPGRGIRPHQIAGAFAGGIGFTLVIFGIWGEFSERLAKWAGSFIVVGAGVALSSLLSLPDLPARARWLRLVANALITVTAGYVLALIWLDLDTERSARSMAVLSVLLAAVVVAIPVLAVANRGKRSPAPAVAGDAAVLGIDGARAAVEEGSARNGERYAVVLARGLLEVGLYVPRGRDEQSPHDRDEVYVVISGSGMLDRGGDRVSFGPGDALFVPAGATHRFEDFSEDLELWVVFCGGAGGEGADG